MEFSSQASTIDQIGVRPEETGPVLKNDLFRSPAQAPYGASQALIGYDSSVPTFSKKPCWKLIGIHVFFILTRRSGWYNFAQDHKGSL